MAGSRHGSDAALAVHTGDVVQPKLAFPHFPPGLVVRRRLLDLLSAGVEQRVTLISAGPGWGKSMLAAQWAATGTAPYPVAWLSLDSYDNDPVVFWSGLLAATRGAGVAPDGGLGGLALRHPFGPTQMQRTLSGLAELSQPLVLVLDDLHEVRNPDVLDGIAAMLRHPSPLRLILLSTRAPVAVRGSSGSVLTAWAEDLVPLQEYRPARTDPTSARADPGRRRQGLLRSGLSAARTAGAARGRRRRGRPRPCRRGRWSRCRTARQCRGCGRSAGRHRR
jgi:hypothetical protein